MNDMFDMVARLVSFKLGSTGTEIISRFTLRKVVVGSVQNLLESMAPITSVKFSHLFAMPVDWKSITIPIGVKIKLTMDVGAYEADSLMLKEVKVVRVEKGAFDLFTYDFYFEKPWESHDSQLSEFLNQKDDEGMFIENDFELLPILPEF